MKKRNAFTPPSSRTTSVPPKRDYCSICNAVVAGGDPQRIVVDSSKIIHTHCFAHQILNNGLSDIKRDVKSIFNPLFDYNNNNRLKRLTFEELIVDVQSVVMSAKFADEVKERVLGSISEYLEKLSAK